MRDELRTGYAIEEVTGEDFSREFHQPQRPEEGGPRHPRCLPGKQLSEQDAVSVQEQPHAILLSLFDFKQVRTVLRLIEPMPIARKGCGALPASESPGRKASFRFVGFSWIQNIEFVLDTPTQRRKGVVGDLATPDRTPKAFGQGGCGCLCRSQERLEGIACRRIRKEVVHLKGGGLIFVRFWIKNQIHVIVKTECDSAVSAPDPHQTGFLHQVFEVGRRVGAHPRGQDLGLPEFCRSRQAEELLQRSDSASTVGCGFVIP